MRQDPMESWRQLTRHYAEMSDGELTALAEDFRDLTDTARQVLRDEMRKRNLGDPQSLASAEQQPVAQSDSGFAAPTGAVTIRAGNQSVIFVWKNTLCDCRDSEEAWQISEVLRRAGIESWLDSSQMYYTPLPEMGSSAPRPRILVAADDLEAARAILARPIRGTSLSNRRRSTLNTIRPCARAVAPPTRSSKASSPQIPGNARCAAANGSKPSSQPARRRCPAKSRLINGKSRPATGQLSPQGE